jgi:DNA polymerase III alpha subunit
MLTNNTEQDLIAGIMRFGPELLSKCIVNDIDAKKYLERIDAERLLYPNPKNKIDHTNWCIPSDYKNLDIEALLINLCPEANKQRLYHELELYKKHDMIPVLQTMKYIVDTLRANNIVWGVGRGSSVASYVLFLLGVHKIDSVKYSLPIHEFFKEELKC